MTSDLLSTRQAADYLSVLPTLLKSMRRHKTGPVWLKVSTRTVRYRKADLDAFRTTWINDPAEGISK